MDFLSITSEAQASSLKTSLSLVLSHGNLFSSLANYRFWEWFIALFFMFMVVSGMVTGDNSNENQIPQIIQIEYKTIMSMSKSDKNS